MSLLQGIKVIELPDRLTDLGGRMLAELGAEVTVFNNEASANEKDRTLAWHHGKHLASDNSSLQDLLADADILLDDRRSDNRKELDNLTDTHPQLVHVIASSFDRESPWSNRPATDLTLMALSGLMTVIGEPQRPPLRLPGEQAYALTGIETAIAALLGLQARKRIGHGQRIDVSALSSTALANYREPIMHEWTGRAGTRQGNKLVRGRSGVRQVWPCKNGFVTWSMIDNPNMMRSIVKTMDEFGVAGELVDIEWNIILVANTEQSTVDRWQGIFASFFMSQEREKLSRWSLDQGWGLSEIITLKEVKSNPHLKERGLFVNISDEQGKQHQVPGPLFLHGAGGPVPKRKVLS